MISSYGSVAALLISTFFLRTRSTTTRDIILPLITVSLYLTGLRIPVMRWQRSGMP
jgi:hypothetical protein